MFSQKSIEGGHTAATLQVLYLRVINQRVINRFPDPVDNFFNADYQPRTGVRTIKTAGQSPVTGLVTFIFDEKLRGKLGKTPRKHAQMKSGQKTLKTKRLQCWSGDKIRVRY